MDLRQIEYILAIEHEQSISRAAESLFITQSALNQQLLKLEKELGTPLFERRKHSMIPTLAGRIYLASAHQIVDIKRQTYRIIQDISEENTGEISIAYTPETGAEMFSKIYPIFHKKYPNITFHICEERVKKMESLLYQKEVTMAFISYFDFSRKNDLDYIMMGEEPIVLGLPKSHPLADLAGEKSCDTLPVIDLKLLRTDDFILLSKETIIREMIDQLFSNAGFRPHVLFETESTRTAVSMVAQQIGAAFFPHSYVDPNLPIAYFTVESRPKWYRTVAFLKGSYLTKPEKYFIGLSVDYTRGVSDKSEGV